MNATPVIERAGSYLNLHASHSGPSPEPHSPRPFITISREAGAGATTLAKLIAQDLNARDATRRPPWRIFDGNLVEAMLQDHRYPQKLAQYLPEDNVSELDAAIGELLGLHPNLWEMVQDTHQLMQRLAAQGHCILIGRGANFATARVPQGLHLRLVGRPRDRAQHMAKLLDIPVRQATTRNHSADQARRRYARAHFNRDVGDPIAYDATFNSSQISPARICAGVVSLVESLVSVPTTPGIGN